MEDKGDKIESALDKVSKDDQNFSQRLDIIERKIYGVYDLNSEAVNMIADMLLFLDNLGKLDNWFYSSVRSKIINETHTMRVKFFKLMEKHIKACNS